MQGTISLKCDLQFSQLKVPSWFQTFAVFCMVYVFFLVIPRRLNFICRRFGTPYLFTTCCVTGPTPTPSPCLLLAQTVFEPNLLPLATHTILKFSHSSPTSLWRWNRQSVPKRRHIKFRPRGITQKKTNNIKFPWRLWSDWSRSLDIQCSFNISVAGIFPSL